MNKKKTILWLKEIERVVKFQQEEVLKGNRNNPDFWALTFYPIMKSHLNIVVENAMGKRKFKKFIKEFGECLES